LELGESSSVDEILRSFELQLLEALGVLPDLAHCAQDDQAIDPDLQYQFFAANARALIDGDRQALAQNPDGETINSAISVRGSTLLALAEFDVARVLGDEAFAREARDVMRALIALQLGGKPLRSRELFSTMVGSGSEVLQD